MVISSEMIDNVVKSNKLDIGEKKGGIAQKKKEKAQAVFLGGLQKIWLQLVSCIP